MPSLPTSSVGCRRSNPLPKLKGRGILVLLTLLPFLWIMGGLPLALADTLSSKGKKVRSPSKAPVSMVVRSDHMLARNIENEITFSGHVHLVKGTLDLRSDDLIVYLKKAGKGQTLMERTKGSSSHQRVETMVATGHVVIHTPRRIAYAGRAVYVQSAHLFVLTEEPVVIQNGDRMSGERITFFTRLNKSVIQGHSLMLLSPHKESKKGSRKTPTASGESKNVH